MDMKMLNKIDGRVKIHNVNIGPMFTKADFISSKLKDEVLSKDGDVHTSYYLKPQYIGEDQFIVRIYFNPDGKLSELLLSITSDGKTPSWENWSKEQQLLTKKKNDIWLYKTIGPPPYEFDWGRIISVFDSLSGSSHIRVLYK